ncbi:hypothetical protein ACJX0J_020624, partial [Zea mays]
ALTDIGKKFSNLHYIQIWIDSLSFEDGVEKKVRAPHLLKEMKFSLGIVHV